MERRENMSSLSLNRIELILSASLVLGVLGITGHAAVAAPSPWCGSERTGETLVWSRMPPAHGAYETARAVARALARGDLKRLARFAQLPVVVRYPNALDVTASTAATRDSALLELARLSRAPPKPLDDLPETDVAARLLRRLDMALAPDGGVRARICHAYEHLGDGGFDELELGMRRGHDGQWRVSSFQIGKFQQL